MTKKDSHNFDNLTLKILDEISQLTIAGKCSTISIDNSVGKTLMVTLSAGTLCRLIYKMIEVND